LFLPQEKGLSIHKEVSMRQYETGFVLSPALSEEETTQFIQQMAEIVAQRNGRMIKQDVWGKRRLAYPIKKFEDGVYVFFTYEGQGDISTEMERRFKQTDSVIRFMTVKKDDRDLARRKKKRAGDEPARSTGAPGDEPAPAEDMTEEK